jgi:hypothetical protein
MEKILGAFAAVLSYTKRVALAVCSERQYTKFIIVWNDVSKVRLSGRAKVGEVHSHMSRMAEAFLVEDEYNGPGERGNGSSRTMWLRLGGMWYGVRAPSNILVCQLSSLLLSMTLSVDGNMSEAKSSKLDEDE